MKSHVIPATAALLVAFVTAALLTLVPLNPAHAASRVDVSTTPSATGSTKVTLSGSGFQYQPNAPGGVYVFFGTVQDPSTNSWAPSQGGKSGETFTYAATSGAQLLVGFEGGSSASASNSLIRADGTWSAEMTIPGSKFDGSSGNPHAGENKVGAQVDCLKVQCGIITIGAHGRINPNNESFTPLSFVTESGAVESGTAAPSFDDEATKLSIPQAKAGDSKTDKESSTDDSQKKTPKTSTSKKPKDSASASDSSQGTSTSSWVVLGVLVVAVLALIAAVIFYVVNRRRQLKHAAAEGAAEPVTNPEQGE
jgi:hypothetical protein